MLVTAIALFFSTFSTPMLSAALHVRPVRRRPLQQRPAELRAGRRLAGGGAAGARAVLGAAEPRAVRRQERRSCTGSRCRPVTWRWRSRYAALVHRDAARRCRSSSFRGGTSNDGRGRSRSSASPPSSLLAGRGGPGAGGARAAVSAGRGRRRRRSTSPRATAVRRLTGAYTRWPPTSTGSAPFSTTAAPSGGWRSSGGWGPSRRPRWLRPRTITPQLYPLLDITTSLDPRFNIAYRFGAVFLAEPYPGGAGRPDLAITLLEKGLRERPDKWEYMQDIGFVHYWYRHDYQAAAEWFRNGAARCRARPGGCGRWRRRRWRRVAIARSSRRCGRRFGSRPKSTGCAETPSGASPQLHALDEIDALQKQVDAFAAPSGRAVGRLGRRWCGRAHFRAFRPIPTRHALRVDAGRPRAPVVVVAAVAAARRADGARRPAAVMIADFRPAYAGSGGRASARSSAAF